MTRCVVTLVAAVVVVVVVVVVAAAAAAVVVVVVARYEVVDFFCKDLLSSGFPSIRTTLCIGGEAKGAQLELAQKQGVHCVVATPGRLTDLLDSGKLNLNVCRYLCLDEGDRMLDLGFDEEVAKIINHFKRQRQTLLFSATMPQKFQDFAKSTLVRPILVNVGRAGAANLDVIQEVPHMTVHCITLHIYDINS